LTKKCATLYSTIGKNGDGLVTNPNDAPTSRQKFQGMQKTGAAAHLKGAVDVQAIIPPIGTLFAATRSGRAITAFSAQKNEASLCFYWNSYLGLAAGLFTVRQQLAKTHRRDATCMF
jgi:hypothetical protein